MVLAAGARGTPWAEVSPPETGVCAGQSETGTVTCCGETGLEPVTPCLQALVGATLLIVREAAKPDVPTRPTGTLSCGTHVERFAHD